MLLVNDQDLVRAGFAMVLGSQPDIEVAGEAADGRAAVRLARERPADVMVMDVRMPGLDGVAATRKICQAAERPMTMHVAAVWRSPVKSMQPEPRRGAPRARRTGR